MQHDLEFSSISTSFYIRFLQTSFSPVVCPNAEEQIINATANIKFFIEIHSFTNGLA